MLFNLYFQWFALPLLRNAVGNPSLTGTTTLPSAEPAGACRAVSPSGQDSRARCAGGTRPTSWRLPLRKLLSLNSQTFWRFAHHKHSTGSVFLSQSPAYGPVTLTESSRCPGVASFCTLVIPLHQLRPYRCNRITEHLQLEGSNWIQPIHTEESTAHRSIWGWQLFS